MSSVYDLTVIGGGLVGGAIAWGAAQQGARVALLDEGDVAYRASRGNFGLVWVQGKGAGMPDYAHWTQQSAQLWPGLAAALAAATGVDVALQQPGGLHFCLSDEELEDRAAMVQRMHNESGDIGTRIIGREEVRAMVPGIGDAVVGAAFCPIDGQANSLRLLRATHAALLNRGGAYLPNRKVTGIDPQPNSFTVHCGEERFLSGKLVIAAGLGSRDLAPMVDLSMPVHPERGQILVTERLRPLLDYATHKMRQTNEGSVMLGDSQEDAGFDASTTPEVMQAIAARAKRYLSGPVRCLDRAGLGRSAGHDTGRVSDLRPVGTIPRRLLRDLPQRRDARRRACAGFGPGNSGGCAAGAYLHIVQQALRCFAVLTPMPEMSVFVSTAGRSSPATATASPPPCSPQASAPSGKRRFPARRVRPIA